MPSRASGTDVLELTTDGDLLDAVVRFAEMRKVAGAIQLHMPR